MTKLTSTAVNEVLMKCLFQEGEDTSQAVIVDGITMKIGFHPDRLEENKPVIRELLHELPEEFSKGGGWTFLNACMDKEGNQWGEHRNIEELLVLGIATKQASYCMPRDMWHILPGGVPYFSVHDVRKTPPVSVSEDQPSTEGPKVDENQNRSVSGSEQQ